MGTVVEIATRTRKTNPQKYSIDPVKWLALSETTAGIPVGQESSLAYSAVYRAVSLISATLGICPLRLYRRSTRDGHAAREEVATHPVSRIVSVAPNDEQTPLAFKEHVGKCLCLWGNFYAEIVRLRDTDGPVTGLYALEPEYVSIGRNQRNQIEYLYAPPDGVATMLSSAEVLHVPMLGSGIVGKSPIAVARESISLGLGLERFGAAFIRNSASPSGVLEYPGVMDAETMARLKDWLKTYTGATRSNKTLLLENGMTWKQVGVPPEDAQFLETRTFQVDEIARWFGVPPHMLAENTNSTYSNISHQEAEFKQYCMMQYFVRIEEEINRKLLWDEPELYVKFNVNAILRGVPEDRVKFYHEMFNMGALSTNDILELEDRNPVGEDGDQRFVPVNLASLRRMKMSESQPLSPLPTNTPSDDEPMMDDAPTDKSDDAQGMMRAVFREVVDRVVGKEIASLRSIVAKAEDKDRWIGDVRNFYVKHGEYAERQFVCVWRPLACRRGRPCNARPAAQRYANEACDQVLNMLRTHGRGAVLTLLAAWDATRVSMIADEYFEAYQEDSNAERN